MMKKLLKKTYLTFITASLACSYASAQTPQIVVTFLNLPDFIEENGELDATDPIIVEIDNIPNGNSDATDNVDGNIRFIPNGLGSGGNLTAAGLNINDGEPDGPIASNPAGTTVSAVSEPGTMPGTFKRTFTFTNLTPRPSDAPYTISTSDPTTQYYLSVRILRDPGSSEAEDTDSSPGDTGSIEVVADTTLAIDDFNTQDISSQIYPSPVVDVLNIGEAVETETYQIIDISGATVLTVDAATANGSINLTNLSSGIYFLVTDAGVAKFVKQ